MAELSAHATTPTHPPTTIPVTPHPPTHPPRRHGERPCLYMNCLLGVLIAADWVRIDACNPMACPLNGLIDVRLHLSLSLSLSGRSPQFAQMLDSDDLGDGAPKAPQKRYFGPFISHGVSSALAM